MTMTISTADRPPLILTLRIDEAAQEFFDSLRVEYFPPERNFLKAHLTLFHKLPSSEQTFRVLRDFNFPPFDMQVTELINLGAGVAYRLDGKELSLLHKSLSHQFADELIPQDKHGFRGHITVQNKTNKEAARTLLSKLSTDFKPFQVGALGLDLWHYLGGPWSHSQYFPFKL